MHFNKTFNVCSSFTSSFEVEAVVWTADEKLTLTDYLLRCQADVVRTRRAPRDGSRVLLGEDLDDLAVHDERLRLPPDARRMSRR